MPPPNYCVAEQRYFTDESDRLDYNRLRTKKHSQLYYWRQHFGWYFRIQDYEIIKDNLKQVKHIVNIRHFVKYFYEKDKLYDNIIHQELYAKNYEKLKDIDHILPILKQLEIN
tara:strand:+ start:90 stop:428 length:339 start_codon:yes stop_codon:yes gene_type:complete